MRKHIVTLRDGLPFFRKGDRATVTALPSTFDFNNQGNAEVYYPGVWFCLAARTVKKFSRKEKKARKKRV